MKKSVINLQFFANISDIMSQHPDAFPEGNDFGDRLGGIQEQLQKLGYDVLINNKENAEFVPASRLSDVVSQRENFKAQAEKAIKDLELIKSSGNVPEDAQKQIDTLIETNRNLVEGLKQANINLGVVTEFDDAINSSDILQFIDKTKLTISKDGTITAGLKEEHDRLKSEKPYLFNTQTDPHKKSGFDGNGGSGNDKATMNSLIRRAAYSGT